jgi:hypothetical protein
MDKFLQHRLLVHQIQINKQLMPTQPLGLLIMLSYMVKHLVSSLNNLNRSNRRRSSQPLAVMDNQLLLHQHLRNNNLSQQLILKLVSLTTVQLGPNIIDNRACINTLQL